MSGLTHTYAVFFVALFDTFSLLVCMHRYLLAGLPLVLSSTRGYRWASNISLLGFFLPFPFVD
jgi:hypothetical protein